MTMDRRDARETWLELTLDYRCNLRCLGCHACNDTGESLTPTAAVHALRSARTRGCSRLWLGGGEPTLREDLLALVRAARGLGFEEVLLQTNGLRLSYPAYRDAVVASGVTEVRLNVKSHLEGVHDRLSARPCHALVIGALAGLVGRGVTLSADVLLARSSLPGLGDTVSFLAARGVTRIVLWLLSAADSVDAAVDAEVPSFAEILAPLAHAADRAREAHIALESLHTPPCTLPAPLRHVFSPASALGLTVVGPDGRAFALATSSFEGGAWVPACMSCSARGLCGGPRADYLRLHGESAFSPLPRAVESLA